MSNTGSIDILSNYWQDSIPSILTNDSLDNIFRESTVAVNGLFPALKACYIFGSSVNSYLNLMSDVDLVVVVDNKVSPVIKKIAVDNRRYEIHVFDQYNFSYALHSAWSTGKVNAVLSMLSGKILISQGTAAYDLWEKCAKVWKVGPRKISNHELSDAYSLIMHGLKKAVLSSFTLERKVIVGNIQNIITELNFRISGKWAPSREWAVRSDEEFASRLDIACQRLIDCGNATPLSSVIKYLFPDWELRRWPGDSLPLW